ncbi:MAG: sulfotransferase [Prochloraceae cyanobacterium]|nr:sulfotransferase [Prochloraceae cyanobacterium]
MKTQILPNFLIIGAAKAGTTALHTYLNQHPQIYMTPRKETNFFALEGETIDFKGPGDEAINDFSITTLDAYQAEFKGVTNEIAIGEACPLYLYNSKTAAKIYQYNPEIKIIVILRNPSDRAYANFLHLIRDDREPFQDFAKALQAESQRIKQNWEWFWHYIQLGYYGKQLQQYYDLFERDRIKIYLYDDFRNNSLSVVQNIFNFLKVKDDFVPDMNIRPNKSGMPKNQFLHRMLTKPNPIKTALKPLFPPLLRQKIQHQNLAKPELTQEIKQELIELYREDILHCQDLIQRDLSYWLSVG